MTWNGILKQMYKSILNICLLVLAGLTISSCNDDYLENTTSAKEVTIPASAKTNETFLINLTVYGSSGCSEFSRFQTRTNGDTTIFKLFQRRDQNLICFDEIIEIDATIEFSFQTTGTKFLKFNESSSFSDLAPELVKSIIIEK